jgi:hypothetical protein
MTTFTTEDRISSMPKENIPKDRTIIKLMNLEEDCIRAIKDLKDTHLQSRLGLVSNLVHGILKDYKETNPQ